MPFPIVAVIGAAASIAAASAEAKAKADAQQKIDVSSAYDKLMQASSDRSAMQGEAMGTILGSMPFRKDGRR